MEVNPNGNRIGTTSACAENTVKSACSSSSIWNYLRVRGEYHRVGDTAEDIGELPPRARRIPQPAVEPAPAPGTTSACAENTICNFSSPLKFRNYLRVRGEYERE